MSEKKVRCHQFIGGRFHSGYGAGLTSRVQANGRQTIDYSAIHLEGRNDFVRDDYSAFEVVPTHEEKRCPGVFHVTNRVTAGTRMSRTYAVIPETGSIEDALSLLGQFPSIGEDEVSAYDEGKQTLTWRESQLPESYAPQERFALADDAARGELADFLAVYWSALFYEDRTVELCFDLRDPSLWRGHGTWARPEEISAEERGRLLIDLYKTQISDRLPRAVRAMASFSLGVVWQKRTVHKAVRCLIVTEDDKNAAPAFCFSLRRDAEGTVILSAGEVRGKVDDAERRLGGYLIRGEEGAPELYRAIEEVLRGKGKPESPILQGYDVYDAFVDLASRRSQAEQAENAGDKARRSLALAKLAMTKLYQKLYKLLRKADGDALTQAEAVRALLPLLRLIVDMVPLDSAEGADWCAQEHAFFAATLCERLALAVPGDETGKHEEILTRAFDAWCGDGAAMSIGGEAVLGEFPRDRFLSMVSGAVQSSAAVWEKASRYIAEHYVPLERPDAAPEEKAQTERLVASVGRGMTERDEEELRAWLKEVGIEDPRRRLELLQPLLLRLLGDRDEPLSPRPAATIRAEIPEAATEADGPARQVAAACDALLTERFAAWSEQGFAVGEDRETYPKALFLPLMTAWLDARTADSKDPREETEPVVERIRQQLTGYAPGIVPEEPEPIVRWYSEKGMPTEATYRDLEAWAEELRLKERERFALLLPVAAAMLSRGDIEPRPAFAAMVRAGQRTYELEEREEDRAVCRAAEDLLTERFTEWAEQRFAQSGESGDFPADLLAALMERWLEEKASRVRPGELDTLRPTFERMKDTLEDSAFRTVLPQIAKGMLEQLARGTVDIETYRSERKWLEDSDVSDQAAFGLLLPLAQKLLRRKDDLKDAGVPFVNGHWEQLRRWNGQHPGDEQLMDLQGREEAYLLQHLPEWVQCVTDAADIRETVENWQKDGMQKAQLDVEQLKGIRERLENEHIDLSLLEQQIAAMELRELCAGTATAADAELLSRIAEEHQALSEQKLEKNVRERDNALREAEATLARCFTAWSGIGFRAGSMAAPVGLVGRVLEQWCRTAAGASSDTIEKVAAKLEDHPEKGELPGSLKDTLLRLRVDAACRSVKDPEARRQDPALVGRLMGFWEGAAPDRQRKLAEALDEAARQEDAAAAEAIARELKARRHRLPEAAAGCAEWQRVQRRLNDEKVEELLRLAMKPEELSWDELGRRWQKDSAGQCSLEWRDILEKTSIGEALPRRLT